MRITETSCISPKKYIQLRWSLTVNLLLLWTPVSTLKLKSLQYLTLIITFRLTVLNSKEWSAYFFKKLLQTLTIFKVF